MAIHLNPEWITCYLECATYNILKEQGAHELGQYLCAADKLYSDTFGWELMRTMTLAEGYEKCDFHFKRGRETRIAIPAALSQRR
jgi:hypothetical protein